MSTTQRVSEVRNPPPKTGSEPPWPELNQRSRRRAEWAVAHHPMPAMMRLVVRTALLHMDSEMTQPCRASVRTLAAKASLSPRTVKTLLYAAARMRIVTLDSGVIEMTLAAYELACDAGEEPLGKLWAMSKKLTDKWTFDGERQLGRADALLLRMRCPELFDPRIDSDPTGDDAASVAAWEERVAEAYEEYKHERSTRFYWVREVMNEPAFARPRRGRSQVAAVKAVALAAELLTDSRGRPFRWTTVEEVAALAGYRPTSLHAVRKALTALEHAGWLNVTRRKERGKGLLIQLTWPRRLKHDEEDDG